MTTPAEAPPRAGGRVAAICALLAVTVIWGATFPLVKDALRDASPLVFNLLRMLIAAAVLVAVNFRALRGLTRSAVAGAALAGVWLALGYELQTAGLARTTPTRSAFLTGLVVVLVPLLAAMPGIRRAGAAPLRAHVLLGALLALAGIVLLTAPAGAGAPLLGGMGAGEWMSLACAFAFAAHLLTLDRVSRRMKARALGTLQIVACALTMVVLLPLEPVRYAVPTPRLLIALLLTSLFATAAAFTVQSWAQQLLPPTPTALLLSMEPVFAFLTAWLLLGERLTGAGLVGAGLILAAILFTELQPVLAHRALARKDI